MKNPSELDLVGRLAVNKATGFAARVTEANQEGGVFVRYLTGWLAGRGTWHRITDLYVLPAFNPRRPYDEDNPEGYVESDRCYVDNNMELAVALLDTFGAK